MAIDQNSALINRDNEILRSNLYSEIIHYMNLKFNNVSKYQFDKFNAFVMQPLLSGGPCEDHNDNEEATESFLDEDEDEPSIAEKLTQQYFSDVWFDEIVEVKSNGIQSIQKQLPDELTSWRVYGTSMHTTKGFAVVRKQAKISVNQEFVIKIHTPASIHEDEVIKVEFSVYNFLKNTLNAQIDVNIENGGLMTDKVESKSNKKCKTYSLKNQTDFSLTQQLPANSMSKTLQFFTKPVQIGTMKIKITAKAGNTVDEVEKIVEVQSREDIKKSVEGSYLVDLRDSGSLEKEIDLNVPENAELVNVYATFSGNLLGPVLDDLSRIR